jgi:hypothetical protein
MRRAHFFIRAAAAGVALAAGANSLRAAASGAPSLTIYHIPDASLSDIAVSPDRLPAMVDARKHVAYGHAPVATIRAAIRAAAPVTLGPEAHSLDARWSAIVAGYAGFSRVACDASGLQGTIDGRRVRFRNRAVVEALRRLFAG